MVEWYPIIHLWTPDHQLKTIQVLGLLVKVLCISGPSQLKGSTVLARITPSNYNTQCSKAGPMSSVGKRMGTLCVLSEELENISGCCFHWLDFHLPSISLTFLVVNQSLARQVQALQLKWNNQDPCPAYLRQQPQWDSTSQKEVEEWRPMLSGQGPVSYLRDKLWS